MKADVLSTLITGSKCCNDLYECLILNLGHGSQRSSSSGIVNQSSVLLLGGCMKRPKAALTSKCSFNLYNNNPMLKVMGNNVCCISGLILNQISSTTSSQAF